MVGNPPWEEITVEELAFYARYQPGLRGLPEAERRVELERLLDRRPELRQGYEAELEQAAALRSFFGADTGYLGGAGDPDLYKLFCSAIARCCAPAARWPSCFPAARFWPRARRAFASGCSSSRPSSDSTSCSIVVGGPLTPRSGTRSPSSPPPPRPLPPATSLRSRALRARPPTSPASPARPASPSLHKRSGRAVRCRCCRHRRPPTCSGACAPMARSRSAEGAGAASRSASSMRPTTAACGRMPPAATRSGRARASSVRRARRGGARMPAQRRGAGARA